MTQVVSGEGVPLDLARAGVGSRTVAAALDGLLQLGAVLLAAILDGVFAGGDTAVLTALVIVEVVLILGGYPIVSEWLGRGRTLGKAAMGLRVVRDDGGPIGFRQALVRGLAGLLLEKPGLVFPLGTAAGLLTLIFSPSSKRIGDMMAGTFVLNERNALPSALSVPMFTVPWPLQPWAMSLDLTRFDDQLALGVRQFVLRAYQLTPAARQQLGEDLRRRCIAVIAPPPPPGTDTAVLLTSLLAERRRRADHAAATSGWAGRAW